MCIWTWNGSLQKETGGGCVRRIGIVGGAGPKAGLLLVERVVALCQQKYGCWQDADFPRITLLNVPFQDMLGVEERGSVRSQLGEALDQLRKESVDIAAVACQTLHGYLSDSIPVPFLSLLKLAANYVGQREAVVLATTKSRILGIHASAFPTIYPAAGIQRRVDQLIENVLRGEEGQSARDELQLLAQSAALSSDVNRVVLGCTELSILNREGQLVSDVDVVDPLELAAQKLSEFAMEVKGG